jgi:hypothetical protein
MPSPKTLEIDSPPEEKLAALKSAAKIFNSDLSQIICRDENDQLLSVSVYAKGEYAAALLRFLESKQIAKIGESEQPPRPQKAE